MLLAILLYILGLLTVWTLVGDVREITRVTQRQRALLAVGWFLIPVAIGALSLGRLCLGGLGRWRR